MCHVARKLQLFLQRQLNVLLIAYVTQSQSAAKPCAVCLVVEGPCTDVIGKCHAQHVADKSTWIIELSVEYF